MRITAATLLVFVEVVTLAASLSLASGCEETPAPTAAFGLRVDSLEITGTVDDAEVSQVVVEGASWPLTSGEFRGTVEVSGKESVQIRATDRAGNAAETEIELR